nr:hypothetical protein [Tanacetum cinerariifolium]
MEMAVEQNCSEKTEFQTTMENVLKEHDHLLTHALGVEIVNIVVNDCMNVNCLTVNACEHCVTTEYELKIDFIKKEYYEMLLKQYHKKIKSSSADDKERKEESKVEEIETQNLELDHKEKVLMITALKEQLKGKVVLPKAVSLNPIDPALLQFDVVSLVPKL